MADVKSYGIKELPQMRGAVPRHEWLKRHVGHDVREVTVPATALLLEPEMVDVLVPEMVDEEVTDSFTDGDGKTFTLRKKTGRQVPSGNRVPSGNKIASGKLAESRNEASPIALILCMQCATIGLDVEPAPETPVPTPESEPESEIAPTLEPLA